MRADPLAVVALIQERQEPWTLAVWKRLQVAAAATDAAEAAAVTAGPGDAAVAAAVLAPHHVQKRPTASVALGRVRFVHHWNYVRVLRLPHTLAVLDTWPYGGCLTALEALSSGRPVLTLPSNCARGRFALSMYRLMGLAPPDPGTGTDRGDHDGTTNGGNGLSDGARFPWGFVAADPDVLVAAVVRLGKDANHRKHLSSLVRAKYPTLEQHTGDAAREWSQLFRGLYRQAAAHAASIESI